jgi:hypothetical protein
MGMINESRVKTYLENFVFKSEKPLFGDLSRTRVEFLSKDDITIPKFINEFWTSRQRQASSIHEISYRACFKPQLPRFFIKLLTKEGDTVYDPFNGRGTTVVEAALLGRRIVANDINPLSKILTFPRFFLPEIEDVEKRLSLIPFDYTLRAGIDLSMFYDPRTEAELVSLKQYLMCQRMKGREDNLDRWIRMVATNRLTGHSSGFFSVYTLPPNQAVTQESQVRINEKRNQKPDYRDVRKIIVRKSKSLLRNVTGLERKNLAEAGRSALFLNQDAGRTSAIKSESLQLTVTSPPFLDIVQYSKDNWLRCWFNDIDDRKISREITMAKSIEGWSAVMGRVFSELFRVTKPGGWVAFEVGEVRKKSIKLDEYVIPLGLNAGFHCVGVLINAQEFTKTANIWGISNNRGGTNTNRIVLFKKGE